MIINPKFQIGDEVYFHYGEPHKCIIDHLSIYKDKILYIIYLGNSYISFADYELFVTPQDLLHLHYRNYNIIFLHNDDGSIIQVTKDEPRFKIGDKIWKDFCSNIYKVIKVYKDSKGQTMYDLKGLITIKGEPESNNLHRYL